MRIFLKKNSAPEKCDIFHIFVQNIDRGYVLKPPNWDGSNEYLRPMF